MSAMNDEERKAAFRRMIDRQREYRAGVIDRLTEAIKSKGGFKATSARNPKYSILLSRGTESAPYRVTSFDEHGPSGHRDYNSIDDAASEFVTSDFSRLFHTGEHQ